MILPQHSLFNSAGQKGIVAGKAAAGSERSANELVTGSPTCGAAS